MLEVIYPGMRHRVVAFTPSKSLRVVCDNNDALIRPTSVDCQGTAKSTLEMACCQTFVQSMPYRDRKGRCGRRIRGET